MSAPTALDVAQAVSLVEAAEALKRACAIAAKDARDSGNDARCSALLRAADRAFECGAWIGVAYEVLGLIGPEDKRPAPAPSERAS